MKNYYSKRASEYERVYEREDPVRQQGQRELEDAMIEALQDRDVLEIACGTGYWTERLARVARSIHATDGVEETIAIARSKGLPEEKVRFEVADAFHLERLSGKFSGALACFWVSHVPRARLGEFLVGLHLKLDPGARVFLADNVYVRGLGGDLVRKHGVADTFKLRTLSDGSRHEVLKNYFGPQELENLLAPFCTELKIHFGPCFWWASYQVRT